MSRPSPRRRTGVGLFVSACAVWAGAAHGLAATLERFPNASATEVAFVAAGNLWTAPLAGGTATRLTDDPGDVVAPRFSPDGRWIAFTGRRANGRDVYVIPASGGAARRLTFDGPGQQGDNLVLGWTPDSQRVLFLSSHGAANLLQFRAFAVPMAGGQAEMLPLDHAGLMSFSPDGRMIAYNAIFRNFELRKRYIGGQQQDIFTFDLRTRQRVRLTSWKGEDTAPMWAGRTIYFLSDRGAGFRANIWAYDLDTRRTRQITRFADYDVDWPSLGAGGITFQQGGKLYAIDLPSERLRELHVAVPGDGARTAPRQMAAGARIRVSDALGGVDYSLSPDGSALLVSTWGDIVKAGPKGAADLTRSPGVDEDHPTWSPDGRLIAYSTDESGEQQVVVRPAAGGPERPLTRSRSGYYLSAVWSPAGDRLAVPDANHGLWLIPLREGEPQRIARDPYADIRDASFSPDGRWLAYSTQRSTRMRAIHLREIASGRDVIVSSPFESDRLPVFTPDGRYLAFVSQRNELPFVSDRDDESIIATLNSDGVYIAPLDRSDPAPSAGAAPTAGRAGGPVGIDLEGLMARAVALPVTPAVIASLEARGRELFYETRPPQLIGGDLPGTSPALHAFDLNTFKDRRLAEGLDNHSLSADGSTVAFRRDGAWRLLQTHGGTADGTALDLGGLKILVDPRRAWTEMLENAWRLDRDVFFSPVMNGTNWQSVHDAYAPLWPLIGSQDDFLYLLGQMQGEIASSHTFIGRGVDFDTRPSVTTPLLGADYVLDAAAGRYRFAHLYKGDQSRPDLSGPLGAAGLDLHEGDYLLAVNGRELRAPAAPLSVFVGLTGPLTLAVAATADGPRRMVTVGTLDDDWPVRHLDWVARNRQRVERLSGGRLGYVALSDFSDEGSKEFVRQFYPQLDKQGLIFDVRWNWGGFTSQAVLDVLRRQAAGVFVNRERGLSPLPMATPPTDMATLMNFSSRSDGDQFPFFFRAYGLGPLIGERSWGGVQGINEPWRLMDGSFVIVPKDSLADRTGQWVIENEGVAPDVAVDNVLADGSDAQLDAAVHVALNRLEQHEPVPLRAPAPLPAYPAGGNVPGASFGAPR